MHGCGGDFLVMLYMIYITICLQIQHILTQKCAALTPTKTHTHTRTHTLYLSLLFSLARCLSLSFSLSLSRSLSHTGHPAMHGRGGARPGYSIGALDYSIWPPRRAQGIHPPRGAHSARYKHAGACALNVAAAGAAVFEIPAASKRVADRVWVSAAQDCQYAKPARGAHYQKLLLAPQRQGCVPLLSARLCVAQFEKHLWCQGAWSGCCCKVLWLWASAPGYVCVCVFVCVYECICQCVSRCTLPHSYQLDIRVLVCLHPCVGVYGRPVCVTWQKRLVIILSLFPFE